MGEFNASKYKNDFAKEKYDRIALNVPKGMKSKIDEYRKQKGFKSLNDYINEVIRRDMYESNDKGTKIIHVDTNDTINM